MAKVHLIKLCVGAETIADLVRWQTQAAAKGPCGAPRHETRKRPNRAAEVIDGGSLYWVIKGVVQCRQRILRLDEVPGADGVSRCGIVLAPPLVPVVPRPRRPFQGWRYLDPADAPPDQIGAAADGPGALPPRLAAALADIGVLETSA